ncbi:VrrB protein [Methylobacterium sp. CM6257]
MRVSRIIISLAVALGFGSTVQARPQAPIEHQVTQPAPLTTWTGWGHHGYGRHLGWYRHDGFGFRTVHYGYRPVYYGYRRYGWHHRHYWRHYGWYRPHHRWHRYGWYHRPYYWRHYGWRRHHWHHYGWRHNHFHHARFWY